jgi:hypothetical protein
VYGSNPEITFQAPLARRSINRLSKASPLLQPHYNDHDGSYQQPYQTDSGANYQQNHPAPSLQQPLELSGTQ